MANRANWCVRYLNSDHHQDRFVDSHLRHENRGGQDYSPLPKNFYTGNWTPRKHYLELEDENEPRKKHFSAICRDLREQITSGGARASSEPPTRSRRYERSVTPSLRFVSVSPARARSVTPARLVRDYRSITPARSVRDYRSITPIRRSPSRDYRSVSPTRVTVVRDFRSVTPSRPVQIRDYRSITPSRPVHIRDYRSITPIRPVEIRDYRSVTPSRPVEIRPYRSVTPSRPVQVRDYRSVTPSRPVLIRRDYRSPSPPRPVQVHYRAVSPTRPVLVRDDQPFSVQTRYTDSWNRGTGYLGSYLSAAKQEVDRVPFYSHLLPSEPESQQRTESSCFQGPKMGHYRHYSSVAHSYPQARVYLNRAFDDDDDSDITSGIRRSNAISQYTLDEAGDIASRSRRADRDLMKSIDDKLATGTYGLPEGFEYYHRSRSVSPGRRRSISPLRHVRARSLSPAREVIIDVGDASSTYPYTSSYIYSGAPYHYHMRDVPLQSQVMNYLRSGTGYSSYSKPYVPATYHSYYPYHDYRTYQHHDRHPYSWRYWRPSEQTSSYRPVSWVRTSHPWHTRSSWLHSEAEEYLRSNPSYGYRNWAPNWYSYY